MDKNTFKNIFNETAKKFGFEKGHSVWFKESGECIAILELQKSKYSNLYYLNVKLFVQGIFGLSYVKNKNLPNSGQEAVITGPPKAFNETFNLENEITNEERRLKLDDLFKNHIDPLINEALTKNGIIRLYHSNKLLLMPAVKKALNINSED
jgi:hypothetical protein